MASSLVVRDGRVIAGDASVYVSASQRARLQVTWAKVIYTAESVANTVRRANDVTVKDGDSSSQDGGEAGSAENGTIEEGVKRRVHTPIDIVNGNDSADVNRSTSYFIDSLIKEKRLNLSGDNYFKNRDYNVSVYKSSGDGSDVYNSSYSRSRGFIESHEDGNGGQRRRKVDKECDDVLTAGRYYSVAIVGRLTLSLSDMFETNFLY